MYMDPYLNRLVVMSTLWHLLTDFVHSIFSGANLKCQISSKSSKPEFWMIVVNELVLYVMTMVASTCPSCFEATFSTGEFTMSWLHLTHLSKMGSQRDSSINDGLPEKYLAKLWRLLPISGIVFQHLLLEETKPCLKPGVDENLLIQPQGIWMHGIRAYTLCTMTEAWTKNCEASVCGIFHPVKGVKIARWEHIISGYIWRDVIFKKQDLEKKNALTLIYLVHNDRRLNKKLWIFGLWYIPSSQRGTDCSMRTHHKWLHSKRCNLQQARFWKRKIP